MTATPTQETIDEFVGAAHGDLATVKHLHEAYPTMLNSAASWGERAIQAAAQTGQAEIAEYLLAAGAPIDICAAAMLGRTDQVSAMLRENPSLAQAKGAHNLPVLYHAAVRGQIAVAQILVDSGTDVNSGVGKNTALHGAAFFGQADMVKWLVEHGAHVNALDFQGNTAQKVALNQGHHEIAAFLEEKT